MGLAGLRMAASMAPKGTKCDFGGSGTEKRKGCQFPLYKNSARAHSVDAVLEEVQFEDADMIVMQGEVADSLYLVQEGAVVAYKGDVRPSSKNAVPTFPISQGEVFGESALSDADS